MSVLDFFRSAPVRIGMKAGFLSAVICRVALFLRVLKLVGHSNSRGGALANGGLSEKSEALLGADS